MTGVGALGPWPGHKVLKAQQIAFDELADTPAGVLGVPPLVQMPKRGPWAEAVARTTALLPEMPVELGTHGWKLADRPGLDLERVRALLREDLDALAVVGHGYTGPLAVTARGPWSLAATLYLARGDRVLSDRGAVRDLIDSLTQGIVDQVAAVRTAIPGVQPVVVLRESLLPDVLGGAVATFSGKGRIPAVPGEQAVVELTRMVDAVRASGSCQVVLHGGVRFASRSLRVLAASGPDAVGLAAASVRGPQWEQVAAVVEQGRRLWIGLPRVAPRKGGPNVRRTADLISRPWRSIGLPVAGLADVVVHTDTSGSGDQVLGNLQSMRLELDAAVDVAAELAERAEAG